MNSREYKKAIIDSLLRKYHKRYIKNISTNRRILLRPAELYKDYDRNNADMAEKANLSEAVSGLSAMGFVSADYLKFSEDIEKIYLSEENIKGIFEYLETEYGVVSRNTVTGKVYEIVGRYTGGGEIVQKYCESILAQADNGGCMPDPERVEANLKMLDFLENNGENLYVREASMLMYGDSKWFEENNYEEICTALRNATGMIREEGERNDAVLEAFHIVPPEQEIFIKGNWEIEWEGYVLKLSKLQGGIAIASGDIRSIKRITVYSESVMTVENKTSYQRMNGCMAAMMYLGGFAGRHQTEFLKKVISDNPDVRYLHFGDIDIGGFLIHKHLCRETLKAFELYHMGEEQLKDARFRNCLRSLTDNDLNRLKLLAGDALYSGVLKYMKEHNVKLEQEIVSYYLSKNEGKCGEFDE